MVVALKVEGLAAMAEVYSVAKMVAAGIEAAVMQVVIQEAAEEAESCQRGMPTSLVACSATCQRLASPCGLHCLENTM